MKRWLLVLALLVLSGCEQKTEQTPNNADAATDKKVELTDDDLPVRADFTEAAESTITVENYKSELDKLAAEIDKD